jgi:hypothetical protein
LLRGSRNPNLASPGLAMYLDPQAGSIVFQVAVAAVLGGALTVRRWWAGAADLLRGMLARCRER